MAKAKVSFKPVRISEDDWNILAECPGVEPVHISGFKSKTEIDEWMNGDRPYRLAALRLREVVLSIVTARGNQWFRGRNNSLSPSCQEPDTSRSVVQVICRAGLQPASAAE